MSDIRLVSLFSLKRCPRLAEHSGVAPEGAQTERAWDMTTIKTSCPVCGDVELTPTQMRLIVCSRSDWSYYSFNCDTCRDEIRKPADDEVVSLLVSGGVRAERWVIPAEALEEHMGAAISYDDVLDFALGLDTVDLVAAMIVPRVQV
jgi:hypothetical protein